MRIDIEHASWREEGQRIYDAALALHAAGLSIFPLSHPISARGQDSAGKHPTIAWKQFQTRRPTVAEVNGWFGIVRGPSDLRNIGIALGPISGVIVVDADSSQARAALYEDGYPIPPKWVATSRGEHWYYGWDEQHPIGNRARIEVGGVKLPVDVRGQGGYVVGPGSLHSSGHVYELTSEGDVEWASLPPLPTNLAVKIERPSSIVVKSWATKITDAAHAEALIDLCASGRTKNFIRRGAMKGERNEQIFRAARDLNGLGVEEEHAKRLLFSNLEMTAIEAKEFSNTIRSAYSSPALPACAYSLAKIEEVDTVKEEATAAIEASSPQTPQPAPTVQATAPGDRTVAELREAAKQTEVISNVETIIVEDDDGKSEHIDLWKSSEDIVDQVRRACNGWPKVLGGVAFSIERWDGESFLKAENLMYLCGLAGNNPNTLLGWMQAKSAEGIYWSEGKVRRSRTDKTYRTPVTKSEFGGALLTLCKDTYSEISAYPTWPIIPDCLYVHPDVPPPTPGFAILEKWVDLFNFESAVDRTIIRAATLTLLWGGMPGSRPCFVVTSDHGRGVGKTATATALCDIVGGYIELGGGGTGDEQKLYEPLVTALGMLRKGVMCDNIKTKVDSRSIESLVTKKEVIGRVNYVGPVGRKNYFTLFITANRPRLSSDVASRAVVIKIGRKRHSVNFLDNVQNFLARHRMQLIGDIIGCLKSMPVCQLKDNEFDRWQGWIDGVLTRCHGCSEALAAIRQQRIDLDVDAEEATDLEAAIIRLCVQCGEDALAVRDGFYCFKSKSLFTFMSDEGTLPDSKMGLAQFGGWFSNKSGDVHGLQKVTRGGTRSWWKLNVGKERMDELVKMSKGASRIELFRESEGGS